MKGGTIGKSKGSRKKSSYYWAFPLRKNVIEAQKKKISRKMQPLSSKGKALVAGPLKK